VSKRSGRTSWWLGRSVQTVLVLGLGAAAARSAGAQQPTASPDSVQRAMEQASVMMVPMFARMAEITLETTLKTLAKPENVDRLAAFMHQYYVALTKQGFTKSEALQIVIAAGLPTAPGAK
jgi:hypothetical protein